MDPISLITSAITSLKTATEITQLLKVSDEDYIRSELKLRLAELMNALADAKISIAELKLLLQEKDEKIRELEQKQFAQTPGETSPRFALFEAGQIVQSKLSVGLGAEEFVVVGKGSGKIVVQDRQKQEHEFSPEALLTSSEVESKKTEQRAQLQSRGSRPWGR